MSVNTAIVPGVVEPPLLPAISDKQQEEPRWVPITFLEGLRILTEDE
jgi:hypothetical protein